MKKDKDTYEIVDRYAKAIFELTLENGIISLIAEQSKNVISILDDEILEMFINPVLSDEDKANMVQSISQIFNLHKLFNNTLLFILSNKRLYLIKDILLKFLEKIDDYSGIIRANVISARPLDPDFIVDFEKILSESFKKTIFLAPKLKENLGAGYIISVGNVLVDASLKTRLIQIRESLGRGV